MKAWENPYRYPATPKAPDGFVKGYVQDGMWKWDNSPHINLDFANYDGVHVAFNGVYRPVDKQSGFASKEDAIAAAQSIAKEGFNIWSKFDKKLVHMNSNDAALPIVKVGNLYSIMSTTNVEDLSPAWTLDSYNNPTGFRRYGNDGGTAVVAVVARNGKTLTEFPNSWEEKASKSKT